MIGRTGRALWIGLLAVLACRGTLRAQEYPDPALTPGRVTAAPLDSLCTAGYTARVRDVGAAERKWAFDEYAVPDSARDGAHYEVDHFIPLALGGSNAPSNLWPETRSRSDHWNAWKKDILEARLHRLVCKGALPLDSAARWIRTDWIEAYGRALELEHPIRTEE